MNPRTRVPPSLTQKNVIPSTPSAWFAKSTWVIHVYVLLKVPARVIRQMYACHSSSYSSIRHPRETPSVGAEGCDCCLRNVPGSQLYDVTIEMRLLIASTFCGLDQATASYENEGLEGRRRTGVLYALLVPCCIAPNSESVARKVQCLPLAEFEKVE